VLINRYKKTLWRVTFALTMNEDSARDLLQEGWFRVLAKRNSWKPGGKLLGYIVVTIRRAWNDRCQAINRASELTIERMVPLDASATATDEGELPLYE